ncbi:hypothetical protein [Telmatospirillum sp. J64-1]|uniref:hypothetical protein n=1 Tax=Telmatospirillum sp. J64-1 TaxID=2502183 RepID=UPI00115D2858|nr:hypothetical protein [Telmatospirillum sp. J64-1]
MGHQPSIDEQILALYEPERQELLRSYVTQILELTKASKNTTAEMAANRNQVVKEAMADGFVPSIIVRMVDPLPPADLDKVDQVWRLMVHYALASGVVRLDEINMLRSDANGTNGDKVIGEASQHSQSSLPPTAPSPQPTVAKPIQSWELPLYGLFGVAITGVILYGMAQFQIF